MMKKSKSCSIAFVVAGTWFAGSVAWAGPPPDPPRQGGIPQCEEQLLICEATSQAFPATGQTSCWDSSGALIDCVATGQDGDIQAGAELSYTETAYTVIDNNTKLEWIKQDDNNTLGQLECNSYPGNLDHDCIFTWDGAFAFVANLNANSHAGHTDWRVPNIKELQSIVEYKSTREVRVSDEFNTSCVADCVVADCSCTPNGNYWSSTSDGGFSPDFAFVVYFYGGGGIVKDKDDDLSHVRAVRGGL